MLKAWPAGTLGALERDVMGIMWGGGDLVVRDVQARLDRPIAYTTVMTTLDRLYKKGFVTRVREGRAFRYTAARSRDEAQAAMAAGFLSGMMAGDRQAVVPILSNLVDAAAADEGGAELLDRLEALVREKRRALQERQG
jgi:predicted transcriptional regulator